jgi:uncharacterized membrane protein
MSNRNRQILVWILVIAAVVLFGYAALTIVLMVRGVDEPGPVRVVTVVANIVTGVLCLWGARLFSRPVPPSR